MNIFEARKLQKSLYKQALVVSFKTMRLSVVNGKLYYHNVIKLNNGRSCKMPSNFISAMNAVVSLNDLQLYIEYNDETIYNSGPGMYLLQVIEID